MAEKRMFTKKITDSDAFIELSSSAQALYFHLNQGADDDGFNNQIQNAMFKSHATIDDLKVLMMKNFIIRFESGVIVIKHWRMHNTLRKDRYTPTSFQEEFEQLGIKDNGSYTFLDDGCQTVANWLPSGCHSIDKNRLDKSSKEKNKEDIIPNELGDSIPSKSPNDLILEEFNEIWDLYPKKQGKSKAFAKYKKYRTSKKDDYCTEEEVLKGVENYNRYIKDYNVEMKFVKNGDTWFNNRCWEDIYQFKTTPIYQEEDDDEDYEIIASYDPIAF